MGRYKISFEEAQEIKEQFEKKENVFGTEFILSLVRKEDKHLVDKIDYTMLKKKNGRYFKYCDTFLRYMANRYNVSIPMIRHILNGRAHLTKKEITKKKKNCLFCKKIYEFFPYRKNSKFCSKECYDNYRRDFLVCPTCGKDFSSPSYENRIYCSYDCSKSKMINESLGEKEIKAFLENIGIKYNDKLIVKKEEGYYKPDIFIEEKNTIIEFYGDYWHCNEYLFENENDYNHSIGMTAKEKRLTDKEREKFLISNGYKIIVIWERDWNKNKTIIKKNLKEALL